MVLVLTSHEDEGLMLEAVSRLGEGTKNSLSLPLLSLPQPTEDKSEPTSLPESHRTQHH
jgi:hypothetical protein